MAVKQPFCSRRCYALYVVNNIRLRSRQIFFRQNLYLRSKIDHVNKYSTLLLVLISLSIGLILLYSTSTEERHTYLPRVLPQVTTNVPPPTFGTLDSKEENSKEQDSAEAEDPRDLPSEGKSSQSSRFDGVNHSPNITFSIGLAPDYPNPPPYIVAICGQAPSNSIVVLYNNGRLCDTVPCKKGRFLFPRVRLKRDKNLLQAKLITPSGDFCYSNRLELVVDLVTSQIQEKGVDIRRGNFQYPRICLSFDGGSNADVSSLILNILKEKQVQATIFSTGEFIRRNPKVVLRMVEDGHEIGNHTDTHPHLAKFEDRQFKCLPWVNREFVHLELKKAEEAFYHLTGKNMIPYWRSPYGESNLEIRKWAEELGYHHVSWTCGRAWEDGLDSLDWVTDTNSVKYHSSEEIRDQILNFGIDTKYGANGGIVLMHLSTSRPPEDAVYTKLSEIIDGLHKKGYEIVKISELIHEKPRIEEGRIKSTKTEKAKQADRRRFADD